VKGDGKSLPFLKRGFSLGRTIIDPEGRLLPRTDVRSMSEMTELDRIAQSRKKDLFVSGALEVAPTREEEKARKWLSMARKTLNRFVGREKWALYGPENPQRVRAPILAPALSSLPFWPLVSLYRFNNQLRRFCIETSE
jgi:hypothetical protein